jgi:hypothetical protein
MVYHHFPRIPHVEPRFFPSKKRRNIWALDPSLWPGHSFQMASQHHHVMVLEFRSQTNTSPKWSNVPHKHGKSMAISDGGQFLDIWYGPFYSLLQFQINPLFLDIPGYANCVLRLPIRMFMGQIHCFDGQIDLFSGFNSYSDGLDPHLFFFAWKVTGVTR